MIAYLITRVEMALFDLKEGYCSTSWGKAKRFCCAPHHGRPGGTDETCGDWTEWGEYFSGERGDSKAIWIWGGAQFGAYAVVAVGPLSSSPEVLELI